MWNNTESVKFFGEVADKNNNIYSKWSEEIMLFVMIKSFLPRGMELF